MNPTLFKDQRFGTSCGDGHRPSADGVSSLPNASATAAAVQPWASSHTGFQCSRGVVARQIRRRSSSALIFCMLTNNPDSDFLVFSGHVSHPYPTPTLCVFHLGFSLEKLRHKQLIPHLVRIITVTPAGHNCLAEPF